MTTEEIKEHLLHFYSSGQSMMLTTSFQTQSLPLLHIIANSGVDVPVFFLDTGFHFPETLQFRDQLSKLLGLKVQTISPPVSLHLQVNSSGRFLFTTDTERCCWINKVLPMQAVSAGFQVWISGVRRDQNENRASMKPIETRSNGTLRFHPMLEWSARDIWDYIRKNDLPVHPLEGKGYFSIGCEPCTKKLDEGLSGLSRAGRWVGQKKTECGLHTKMRV